MRNTLALAAAAAFFVPAAAFADAAASTPDAVWKGQGELGYAAAHGNSDNENLVGKLGASLEDGAWKHSLGADFLYSKSTDADTGEKEETAKRYEIFGSSGLHFTGRSYVFGSFRNEHDDFASYEWQWTAAVGYGYEAIKNDKMHLTFEIGPGYRWSKEQGVRVFDNSAIVRGWSDFGWKLTDTTSLFNTLLIESGSDNTFVKDDVGLQVQMSKALALKAGWEIRNNSDVQPGTHKTDTLTTVNVVYGF